MTLNIANSLLILGSIYLHLVHGLDSFVTLVLVIWALFFWAYYGFIDERKKLLQSQIELTRAKTNYYDRREKHD